MPSTTPLQKAAFDVIDTLHFNQILMSFVYEEPLEDYYHHILNRINEILQEKGLTGKQAEINKHYILANLEICLSIDKKYISDFVTKSDKKKYEQFTECQKNFSLAMLSVIIYHNDLDRDFIDYVVKNLLDDKSLALSTMPFFVKYRLTECCYAFEYPDASLGFYYELVSRDIILCKKYSRRIDCCPPELGSELSLLFIRAGLIVELKMLQKTVSSMMSLSTVEPIFFSPFDPNISRTEHKLTKDYYKRLIDTSWGEKKLSTCKIFPCKEHVSEAVAKDLLTSMNKYYFHKRMFNGTQGSWLGTLGAFDIEASRWHEPNKAIYYETNNSNTISESVRVKLSDYGFSVTAKSLYLRHKKIIKDSYPKIKHYYNFLLSREYALPWYYNNYCYYDEILKLKMKEK